MAQRRERPLEGKTVGRRHSKADWESAAQLLRTVAALRPVDRLVPRGVYRFDSFEEADAWMTRTIARTLARRRSQISPGSAAH